MGILQLLAQVAAQDPLEGWRPIPPGWSDQAPAQPTEAPPPVFNEQVPQAGAPVPQMPQKRGLLAKIGDILSPRPESWLYSAMNNPNGIWGARGAQQDMAQQRAMSALELQAAQDKVQRDRVNGEYKPFGNSILHVKPDGTVDIMSAPATPSPQEKLIDRWKNGSPEERALIERILPNFRYTPDVIAQEGRARTATTVAGARARGQEARITKRTKGAGSGSGGGKGVPLPSGAVIIP